MADPITTSPAAPSSTAHLSRVEMPVALADAEARIEKLEMLLADKVRQQEREAADQGLIARLLHKVFGKSWATTLPGLLAGVGGIAAMVPSLDPRLHTAAGVVSAVGMLLVGVNSKSKNITGTEK